MLTAFHKYNIWLMNSFRVWAPPGILANPLFFMFWNGVAGNLDLQYTLWSASFPNEKTTKAKTSGLQCDIVIMLCRA